MVEDGAAIPAHPRQLKLGIAAPIEMHKYVSFTMHRLD